MGAYDGRMANMMARDYVAAAKSLGGPIVALGIATEEGFARTLVDAQTDVDSPRYRCVAPFFISFGRRPG